MLCFKFWVMFVFIDCSFFFVCYFCLIFDLFGSLLIGVDGGNLIGWLDVILVFRCSLDVWIGVFM